MKVTVLAFGSRGDVQPYMALAQGLKEAGHAVTFCTSENFKVLVEEHDIPFAPISIDLMELLQGEKGLEAIEKTRTISFLKTLSAVLNPAMQRITRDMVMATQGTDFIVAGGIGTLLVAHGLRERQGIPYVFAPLQHILPTSSFESIALPSLPRWVPLRSLYNYLSHILVFNLLYPLVKGTAQTVRRELELPLLPSVINHKSIFQAQPVLYGFSSEVLPIIDLPPHVHVCGYWTLKGKDDWKPPQELVDFLNYPQKPIYIGFGSMTDKDPKGLTVMLIEALELMGERAVISKGWANLGNIDLPDSIFVIDSVPHEWLFPKVAAAIHHGGAGTTSASMRAGIPTGIIPFIADQFFWGKRIMELGVGPNSIPRKKLTSKAIALMIKDVTTNKEMQHKARELGERLRQEDGVTTAVTFIEQYYNQSKQKV